MEFRLLKTFDVVAMLMSFHRAAEVLHLSQSTVSAQIKALENELGAPVFERLGRHIALTSAGEELRHHTRRLLGYEQELMASLKRQHETTGLITLRVPQSVADTHLPPIMQRFTAHYPRVGFDISNCGYHHLADELRTGQIDAAFLLAGSVTAADLTTSTMLIEPMVYVASPTSTLAPRSRLGIRDLAEQTLLLPKHDCGYRMQLERSLTEAGVEVAAIIELNSLASLIQCLLLGVGVALLPRRSVARELAQHQLKELSFSTPLTSHLFLIRHRHKPLDGVFGAFMTMVEEHFTGLRGNEASGPARAQQDLCGRRRATKHHRRL